jgi:hypothetical protein
MKTNDFRKLSFLATPIDRDSAMTSISLNSEVCQLHAQEERILASFTGRLIEIAAVAGARGSCTSPIAALNAMRLPADRNRSARIRRRRERRGQRHFRP